MATDYFSRAELDAAFCKASAPAFDNHGKATFIVDYVKVLETIPAAEVRPVVRGKWKRTSKSLMACSVCGNCVVDDRISGLFFCFNCGADMKETEDEKA